MPQENEKLKAEIIKKVEAGEELTSSEEFFYLTEVMHHTPDEANVIIAISDNKNKNVIID